jgi:hypothetical protein
MAVDRSKIDFLSKSSLPLQILLFFNRVWAVMPLPSFPAPLPRQPTTARLPTHIPVPHRCICTYAQSNVLCAHAHSHAQSLMDAHIRGRRHFYRCSDVLVMVTIVHSFCGFLFFLGYSSGRESLSRIPITGESLSLPTALLPPCSPIMPSCTYPTRP